VDEENAMTITTRRLAHRFRERLATEPDSHLSPADPTEPEAPSTVDNDELAPVSPQENVDATK
jgi:hypothetical protein